ncbi:MAG: xanthine dehydrogenase family protein molybdopterin-binding subunit [Candidatus Promineifilaceae bacterium]
MTNDFSHIGRPARLVDGRAKVTGASRYVADIRLPGALHARPVLSPHAHATIEAIDPSAALATPGVVSVLTAADLPAIPPKDRHCLLLARGRVIFAGQPVALVLAESEAAAADAAERVSVTYRPRPAATTLDQALAAGAPLVWPAGQPGDSGEAGAHGADLGSGDAPQAERSNVHSRRHYERGDVQAGFAAAAVVVERTFTTSRLHQGYLEPQACLVQPDPLTGGATVWTSTQAPFWAREEVAAVLEAPESEVRVVPAPVGGGFGGKFVLYEPLLALAARHLGRPVRLALSRLEEMLAANPAPSARLWLKVGAGRDGRLTAIQADVVFESGCYPSFNAISALLVGSIYQVPNLDIQYTEVLTFRASASAYRAPGAPQAAFALESVMDELAGRLELDPIELRLRNASNSDDPMANGRSWGSIGMRQVLEALRDHPAWQGRAQARAAGRGVGVAIGGWPGGMEPAAATCTLNRDGRLQLHIGSVDLTGTATGLALLAAEAFGLSPDKVQVVNGDTASAPYAGAAGGSKTTYTVGPAVIQAAQEARAQTLRIAADEFEADPADLEIVDGQVRVRGVPGRAITLAALAAKTMDYSSRYAPVLGHGRHANPTASPAFCAQLAEVEVDAETGQVQPVRLVLVQDVGRAINPAAIEGQMRGGAVQGLGWALYERLAYDDAGQVLTGTWMEYALPHIDQAAPRIETVLVEVPAELGPFGARGVGEPPVIATAAAVANAIADATGKRPADLPITAEWLARADN